MSKGRDNVQMLMKWEGSKFPWPFQQKSTFNNSYVSKYTMAGGAVTAQNRISSSNVEFLLSVFYAMKEENNTIALGGTVSDFICEKQITKKMLNAFGTEEFVTDGFEIAIYNEIKGEMTCFYVDRDSMKISADKNKVSSICLLGSLWEELYQDEEFYDEWNIFNDAMNENNIDAAWNAISILSDNIYRRILGENIEINVVNNDINEVRIEQNIASGAYSPTSVTCGFFHYLKKPEEHNNIVSIQLKDFVGKYVIDPTRVLTAEEQKMVNENILEDYYILDDIDVEICTDIVQTTKTNKPFRTFTLVGRPGSGKSMKSKAVANGVSLPETKFCCHPGTEIFDMIGQVMPPTQDELEREAWEFASKLEELGGINFKNIAKLYDLPVTEDILVCPEEVYKDLTGNKTTPLGKAPTINDAVKAWSVYMTEKFNDAIVKLKVSMKTGSGFRYTETDFIRAIEKGYVLEVQEPNVILNEGVMVGLNSLLNEGIITLQTGKTIYRHKDSVIFFTTNHELNGLRDMNQSFIDRSAEVFFVERPTIPVVADRIMAISGLTDRKMAIEMATLGETLEKIMDKEGIDDGVCGLRSLINWAIKSSYMNPYDAAIKTLVNKTSMDIKNRNRLMRKLDESWFYQFRGR